MFESTSDRGSKSINLRDRIDLVASASGRARSLLAGAVVSKPLALLLQGPAGPFFGILAGAPSNDELAGGRDRWG